MPVCDITFTVVHEHHLHRGPGAWQHSGRIWLSCSPIQYKTNVRLSALGPVYEPLNDIEKHVPDKNAVAGSGKTSWTSHHPLYLKDVPDVR
jgi:hypothetical protein